MKAGAALGDKNTAAFLVMSFISVSQLAGCVGGRAIDRIEKLEKRVLRMEQQLKLLTTTGWAEPIPMPYRNTKELKNHLVSLERERAKLSRNFSSSHPKIVDLDRRIRWRKRQIQIIENTPDFWERWGKE